MPEHMGRCLCGGVRFQTRGAPLRVTICHCRFCQRSTGSAFMVEPIFPIEAFEVLAGTPKTFSVISEGSGGSISISAASAAAGSI